MQQENGIVVFNTPGANANGVKELTICALFLASRGIVRGVGMGRISCRTDSIAKAVKKENPLLPGVEIAGKTLGVIGLGAIGGMVANSVRHLDMKVVGCDPYISVDAAWRLSVTLKRRRAMKIYIR